MKVSINGEFFDYDQNRLLMAEMLELEKVTGLGFGEWQEGLGRLTAKPMGALAWLLWRRAGRDVPWADIESGAVELNLAGMGFERDDEPPPGPTPAPVPREASPPTGRATSGRSAKSA